MKMKKAITIILLVIVFLSVSITISNAGDFSGLNGIYNTDTELTGNGGMGAKIVGIAEYLCYGAAVIVLIYKGVQFMAKAPEAKAEAKKELVSYAIGAFILFAVGGIIRIVGKIALNDLF